MAKLSVTYVTLFSHFDGLVRARILILAAQHFTSTLEKNSTARYARHLDVALTPRVADSAECAILGHSSKTVNIVVEEIERGYTTRRGRGEAASAGNDCSLALPTFYGDVCFPARHLMNRTSKS